MVKVSELYDALLHPEAELLPGKVRQITEEEVKETLTVSKSIELAREAYLKLSTKQALNPERAWFTTLQGTSFYCMPSYIMGRKTMAVKIARSNPDNVDRSLPSVMATIHVYDASNGQELAQIEAETLTALRTAASSAVATHLLARGDATRLGIFGTGRQAEAHIPAICHVRDISKIIVYSRNQASREAFARKTSETYKIRVQAASSPQEVVDSSDILVLATSSKTPLFPGENVNERTHVNAIGASLPDAREVDTTLARRSTIVVDYKPQALTSYGDIITPIKEGAIKESDVAELGNLLVHPIVVMRTRDRITLFKSGGVAALDALTADFLLSPTRTWNRVPEELYSRSLE